MSDECQSRKAAKTQSVSWPRDALKLCPFAASPLVSGFIVAPVFGMARRVGALLGIAVLLGLMLVLMWEVYRHHQAGNEIEETTVVSVDAHAA